MARRSTSANRASLGSGPPKSVTASRSSSSPLGNRVGVAICSATGGPASTSVAASTARSGGGTLPIHEIPSHAVRLALPPTGPEELARRLRRAPVPVVGRVYEGSLWLDARTLLDGDETRVVDALTRAYGAAGDTVG